jgi:hypothetical protein
MRGRDLVWRFGARAYPVARPLREGGRKEAKAETWSGAVVVEPWAMAKWWPGGGRCGVWPQIDLLWKYFRP